MVQSRELTITKLAQACGVKRETIRFYEQRGLLPAPPRSAAGYRLYSPDEVRRIRFIKTAQGLGFSLEEIGDLLALRASPDCTCGEVKARAMGKVADIEAKIATLAAMKSTLIDIAASCGGGELPADRCPILVALDQGAARSSGHPGATLVQAGNVAAQLD